ncbi:MAG: phosphatase PAP2 family protein [Roseiarcus sp.]|jgi:membrane-associated phospholipid phosphatase
MAVAPKISEPSSCLVKGAWIGCFVAVAASAVVAAVSRTSVTPDTLAYSAGLVAIPAAIYLVYSRLRPDPVIAAVGGSLALTAVVSLAVTIMGLAALRLHMPLIDPALARADAAIGLTSPDVLAWLARHKTISDALGQIYLTAGPLIFIIIPLLAFTRQTWRLWEFSFVFTATVTLTVLTSVFFPAIGAVIHYNIGREILAQLPPGAGRLYVPTFEAFRSGALQTIDIHHLEGVVTFPSFHAIMALMIAHAWRGLPGATLVKVWAALVIVSAIPVGGHYVIDLIAGGALWGVVAVIASRMRGTAADAAGLPAWRMIAAPSSFGSATGPARLGGADGKSDFPL